MHAHAHGQVGHHARIGSLHHIRVGPHHHLLLRKGCCWVHQLPRLACTSSWSCSGVLGQTSSQGVLKA